MSMTGRGLVLALLVTTMYSQPTFFSTQPNIPTTSPGLECMCLPCSYNPESFTKHVQKHFCDSVAVILGRVTATFSHGDPQGVWNSPKHMEALKQPYGFPPRHYELNVRVLKVYSNKGETKLKTSDKIIIRYARQPECSMCETLVENFQDQAFTDRRLHQTSKYIFFLPALFDFEEPGGKVEAVMSQCSKVWRWSKRGNKVPGHIPMLHRYILSNANCTMCRVSGCYQNNCVKADEVEECGKTVYAHDWKENACQPLLDHGLCYYNSKTDSCRWAGISEDGKRGKGMIDDCLPLQ